MILPARRRRRVPGRIVCQALAQRWIIASSSSPRRSGSSCLCRLGSPASGPRPCDSWTVSRPLSRHPRPWLGLHPHCSLHPQCSSHPVLFASAVLLSFFEASLFATGSALVFGAGSALVFLSSLAMVFSPDADRPLAAVQEKGPENVRALVFVACKESRAVLRSANESASRSSSPCRPCHPCRRRPWPACRRPSSASRPPWLRW